MKILDKPTINRLKAAEQKKESDEGFKLAQAVDKLRETKAAEEENLRKFRDESLKVIKADIDTLLKEKEVTKKELEALEQAKEEASKPVDLTNKYLEVENLKRELLDRETTISMKEIELIGIEEREKKLRKKEEEIEANLSQAQINYQRAEEIRSLSEQGKMTIDNIISKRSKEIMDKEIEFVSRENEIKKIQDETKQKDKELLEKGTSLIERELSVEAKAKELFEKEEEVKEQQSLTVRYNTEADKNYSISENVKTETLKLKEEAEKDISNRYRELQEKEEQFTYKEHDLSLEKEKIENDKKDIEKEKLHIASQQETLRNAWVKIKQLQTNKE